MHYYPATSKPEALAAALGQENASFEQTCREQMENIESRNARVEEFDDIRNIAFRGGLAAHFGESLTSLH